MYVFVHSQAQKYVKIFLVFRIFRVKMMIKRMPPHHCEGIPVEYS